MHAMDRRIMSRLVVVAAVVLGVMIQTPSASAAEHMEFRFFLHESLISPNETAFAALTALATVPGALPNNQTKTPSLFGAVIVFDDPLTKDPDSASCEVGRGRGLYVFDANDQKGTAIEFLWTAEFNDASGHGAGSTLTLEGFDRTTNPVREIAITGGTGRFRLARGWAVITTYSLVGVGVKNVLNVTANVYCGV